MGRKETPSVSLPAGSPGPDVGKAASLADAASAVLASLTDTLMPLKRSHPSMFGGAIDEVHLYQGILNDREIANISSAS